MAEGMLYGVAQKIVEELGSRAFKEIASLWQVEAELENIKNTVSTILAVLKDAAEQKNHNNQVKDWLEKLNDAVYEADDLLGEFYAKALRRGAMSGNIKEKVRGLFSTSNSLVFRPKMSRKIIAMKQKLNTIAEDSRNFPLIEFRAEPPVSVERDETHSFVADESVIGRGDDKKAIIKLLLEPNNEENVSIVPIVGIGGLGKTTLAQFVYNDKNIKEHFELRMWICISRVFDVKVIIQKIISSATREEHEDQLGKINNQKKELEDHSMDKLQDQLRKINIQKKELEDRSMDELQYQLRNIINQKKYLLVLDDVWNEDHQKWESLKELLVGGAKGSKIIITTRAGLVAKITCPASTYTLKGLNKEQSCLLFKQITYRKGQRHGTNNPKLEEIGRKIVQKCQGMPLAIKSIGKVLSVEETERNWSYVNDNMLETATEENCGIFPILKLSYDHLPLHLKACFAFCSLFPKDYEIDKVTLRQLWIAQGYIRPSNKNRELEDVADEYFKNLLWRSFFEEVRNENEELKYKMHDLIHHLAQLVATAECRVITLDSDDFEEKTRHVSLPFYIDSSFIETSTLLVRAVKLRTFLAVEGGRLDKSKLKELLLSFRKLRALGLCRVGIQRVPDSIRKLIHLTYLDFSGNDGIETLPNAISRLWKLQTLKVNDCSKLKELPRDIRFLVGLRHLENRNCVSLSHIPYGLGQMTCLQTLSLFVVRDNQASTYGPISSGLDELKSLNSLRGELEISNLRCLEDVNSEPNAAYLRAKQYLDRLTLCWYANHSYHDNGGDDGDSDGDEGDDGDDGDSYGDNDGDSDVNSEPNAAYLRAKQYLDRLTLCWYANHSYHDNGGDDGDSDGDEGDDGDDSDSYGDNDGDSDGNDDGDNDGDNDGDDGDNDGNDGEDGDDGDGDGDDGDSDGDDGDEKLLEGNGDDGDSDGDDGDNDGHDGDEKLLEGLQPHKNLKLLSVWGYGGVRFSSWLSSLTNLVDLSITGCKRCQQLPQLSQLHSLERLLLHSMEVLEYISDGDINEEVPTSSFFPSLKSISICECPKLKGWWRSTSTTDHQQHPHHRSLPSFHHLSKFDIQLCGNLTSLPPFPYLEESLFLWDVSLKALQPTIAMTSSLPSSSSFLSSPFSKLKSMKLWSITDTEALPDEWMSNLSSLKQLQILGCPKLKSLSLAVPHLTSLESLEFRHCELFDSISDMGDDGTEWQHLKCLSSLIYFMVPNLKSIPSGLQHVTALRKLVIFRCPSLTTFPELPSVVYLYISGCPSLTSIPDGISKLTSLEELHIDDCRNLKSLPDGMVSLKSLQKLIIQRCPQLAERCEKGVGEDRFKIAHVPVILIRN